MASQNKKNKARNSFIYNGGEKIKDGKLKGMFYFTKALRHRIKDQTRKSEEEMLDDDIV